MSDVLNRFDRWLDDQGPAALILREHLVPVEGPDGVLFPPTFAPVKGEGGFKGGYNIDTFAAGNICLVDTVGSQANRMEPLFLRDNYADLVPQVVIKAGQKKVNLLEAGHRAGDAVIRCTELQGALQEAFHAAQKGDATRLAKIAPTSIVFGVWDSRVTQTKLPRLISSTIRAYNVRRLTRSAQYVPVLPYVDDQLLPKPEDDSREKLYGKRGFIHVPASATHGGIIADGGIRRDAALHLACLRLLNIGADGQTLRRYILGLALTAFTYPASGYLRQGCHLVADPEKPREFEEVYSDGRRSGVIATHEEALAFACAAAKAFGVGDRREVEFIKGLAQEDLSTAEGDSGKKAKRAAKGRS